MKLCRLTSEKFLYNTMKFRFANPALNTSIDSLMYSRPYMLLTPKEFYRSFAGNLIELAYKKYNEIVALDIPQEDKDIAYDILDKEKRAILVEFHQNWTERNFDSEFWK